MSTLLEVDREVLVDKFAREPFKVRHNLADEPLLTLERMSRLAAMLPDGQLETASASVDEVVPDGVVPTADIPPDEMVLGIETNDCWMNLKRIEIDPEYEDLLQRCLDEVVPHVADREGGETRREGYIFLSAPNSTTPAHFDPEHNLLLQIRGTKTVYLGPFDDDETERRHLERYYGGGTQNVEELPKGMREYVLEPGEGLYFPVHFPHLVKNGPAVSTSLSITFYTEETERQLNVHAMNARLRRVGLSPKPPGSRPAADRAKSRFWGAMRKAKKAVRREAQR